MRLPARLAKKWMRLDIAFAMARHATQPKADAFVEQVREYLASSGSVTIASGTSGDSQGEGFSGCEGMRTLQGDGFFSLPGYSIGCGRGHGASRGGKGYGNIHSASTQTSLILPPRFDVVDV